MAEAQKPIADIRRRLREHSENGCSYADGKADSLDAHPHCQPFRRMRRVMNVNARANLRALSAIISQNEADIQCCSGQHGQLKKPTEDTVQLCSDHFVTLTFLSESHYI